MAYDCSREGVDHGLFGVHVSVLVLDLVLVGMILKEKEGVFRRCWVQLMLRAFVGRTLCRVNTISFCATLLYGWNYRIPGNSGYIRMTFKSSINLKLFLILFCSLGFVRCIYIPKSHWQAVIYIVLSFEFIIDRESTLLLLLGGGPGIYTSKIESSHCHFPLSSPP
jgi:hypothetical protein